MVTSPWKWRINMQEETKVSIKADTFICPSCAGALKYDAKKDQFLCGSCGYSCGITAAADSIKEHDFSEYAKREKESVAFQGVATVECQNCGSQVTFGATETATTCPMCGSTQISQAKQRAGIPPEGIIPFKVDKQEASQKFREWIKGLWFAPNRLKNTVQEGRLTGKFVPFWTYDAEVIATYVGEGGKYRKVKNSEGEEETVTDWFPTAGVVTKEFDDFQVCAVEKDGASDVEQVGPFDTVHNLKPFSSEYLAGYNAEIYSIKADAGFKTAKQRMESDMFQLAQSDVRKRFDTCRSVVITPKFTNVTYKHVLLPVWSSKFGYGGKAYRYVINGDTGNVYGDRPYSPIKITVAVAITVAVIILLCILLFCN